MAFYGTNPDGDYFKLTARATAPTFFDATDHAANEGALYFNSGTGTISAGLWVYSAGTDNAFVQITKNIDAAAMTTGQLAPDRGGVAIGTIISWAGASTGTGTAAPPTGYILCNGSTPGGTGAYASLYAAIGNKWGGTDAASMKIPDLRGKFIRMVDHGAGVDPDAGARVANDTGGNTGDNVGSYQADAFEDHTHQYYKADSHNFGQSGPVFPQYQNLNTSTGATGTTSTETRAKNVYVEFYIKYIST